MHFSLAGLLLGTLFSAVGAGLFLYGKRQARVPHLVCGMVLAIVPWFVTGVAALLGVGIVFTLAPFAAAWWFGL